MRGRKYDHRCGHSNLGFGTVLYIFSDNKYEHMNLVNRRLISTLIQDDSTFMCLCVVPRRCREVFTVQTFGRYIGTRCYVHPYSFLSGVGSNSSVMETLEGCLAQNSFDHSFDENWSKLIGHATIPQVAVRTSPVH